MRGEEGHSDPTNSKYLNLGTGLNERMLLNLYKNDINTLKNQLLKSMFHTDQNLNDGFYPPINKISSLT